MTRHNPLKRALARWESEGGSADPDWVTLAGLIHEDEHILHCLGAAVVINWHHLPVGIQRELFMSAASITDPLPASELKEHIARFLHAHKGL